MKSGIYKISFGDKNYIGSAVSLNHRFSQHIYRLKLNTHHNIILQRCYNKYGKDKMNYEILVKCPPEYLIKLEQWFINNTPNLINHNLIAGSMLGYKFSEESKIKMSKSFKDVWTNPEYRIKMSNNHKNKKFSEETKLKMSSKKKGDKNSLSKLTWDIVNEIRSLSSIMKLTDIANKYNIHKTTASRIKNNKTWIV